MIGTWTLDWPEHKGHALVELYADGVYVVPTIPDNRSTGSTSKVESFHFRVKQSNPFHVSIC